MTQPGHAIQWTKVDIIGKMLLDTLDYLFKLRICMRISEKYIYRYHDI